ncbi:hypothetical protein RFI_00828 [Reticulomyxa filosa]|uniref:Uncharacterized protein n=1 Tax=Reticulomyxa filosa TaxID=46433 RepID=X6PDU7_RETFI|nr:hypothetical protein RFI_00828 [Reticulomyxa filosa]|eukprot:ETO36234.1 hypothetical protein RFI_00828 [Reticulomyxa filosa]
MKYFKPSHIMLQNSSCVTNARFLPDGKQIISSALDGVIRIWDVKTGKQVQLLENGPSFASDLQFSRDGNRVVFCLGGTNIRLWDIKAGQTSKKLHGHTRNVTSVQFSPDGNMIASSSVDATIRLWDVTSTQQIQVLEGHVDCVNYVAFSTDSRQLIKTLLGHSSGVNKAKFSQNGKFVVSCSVDFTTGIWNVESGQLIISRKDYPFAMDAQFFPDGQTVVSYLSNNQIQLIDVKLGMDVQVLRGHWENITGIDISSDGNLILSSSNDSTVRLWEALL